MLLVHRSERADLLVEALADLLLSAPGDPFAPEVIAVPTRGVERWLIQRLSHRLGTSAGAGAGDGVCANVEFPFPGSLVGQATAIACELEPDDDPWPPERSVWSLLDLVDIHLEEPFLEPLAAHLRAGSPSEQDGTALRRFATVRHLANLYDTYSVHRPEMIESWLRTDPDGSEFTPADASWQAELWRRLRSKIGSPSPVERLGEACTRLAAEPGLLDLPDRISLFGLTRLPASHLRVLEAIATARDVHLFLLHPSGALWQAMSVGDATPPRQMRRRDDRTVALAANPLLRSWGRDSRELQLVLQGRGVGDGEHRPVIRSAAAAPNLLELLQSDVRENRAPAGLPEPGSLEDARPLLDPDDASLRVHACHGRLRQVEVMRDAILHLLAEDPSFEPRDVIVMCPDIETFAPLIHAVFGTGTGTGAPTATGAGTGQGAGSGTSTGAPTGSASWALHGSASDEAEPGPPRLRVRLADRSIRQTNPVLAAAAQLLELASGRLTASEVLDFAAREPVSRRFRFDESDLTQLERWVVETGVRWGYDSAHRAPWKLDHVEENTWQGGLDRVLLGVTMAEEDERLFEAVLPLDDVSSSDVDLAGRFAEFVERLGTAIDRLHVRQTPGEWAAALADSAESLAAASVADAWQHDQLRRVLDDVAATAVSGDVPSASLLDLAEARALLEDRLRGRPTRANFRTGDLTICTLVPMRSVPHRVVGLLGLDDGAFPRHPEQDGDDLLLADPHVGDRDARSEDRQLLLDALLAAGEHLVVTYEGRDPRTNQERSPCVPVAELLDVVDRTVRVGDDPSSKAREIVVVQHPLQSFDHRNFVPSALAEGTPWSFDPVDLGGARALAQLPQAPPPFLEAPLSRLDNQVVQLDSLVRFLEHPVKAFLRERLSWYGTGGAGEVKDSLPVELDALEQWGVGDRMLAARLAGASTDDAWAVERARGLLPPGALATAGLSDVEAAVDALAQATAAVTPDGGEGPGSIEVNLLLPDGRSLVGTVPDVYVVRPASASTATATDQLCIVRCLYSKLAPKHRLAAYARWLALTAARPAADVSAVTIGRGMGRSVGRPRITRAELGSVAGSPSERRAAALALLGVLVELYDRGLCEPLPLGIESGEAYADAVLHGEDPREAGRKRWNSGGMDHREDKNPEHLLVFGGQVTFDEVLGIEPVAAETGAGWSSDPSRFGRLARRLWEPVLARQVQEHLG